MRPLDGIVVLELARVAPGQLCTLLLGDMGADVLRIETPRDGGLGDGDGRRSAFSFLNRNKRSIALDLKDPDGQQVFRRLAERADVIVEGFRPGVMARLGADYDTVRSYNPRVVYCSLSGFGQDGPYRDRPAHDLNYISLAGVLGLIGEAGRKPAIPLNLVADYAGASLHGALGIMFALYARERTGEGQHVDISYLDTTVALLAAVPSMWRFFSDGVAPRRGEGFTAGTYPYYAVYETADAKLLSIGCTEPWLWENFCKAVDRPDLARFCLQPDHMVRPPTAEESAARDEVEALIRTRTRDEWFDLLAQRDVCVGKVHDVEEVVADPQVRHRGMVVELDHPVHGAVRQFGVPIKLSATPGAARSPAPRTGEHSDEVLAELGFEAADIARLRERGVVG